LSIIYKKCTTNMALHGAAGYVREADIIKRIAALVTKIKARAPAELNATASCAPVYICDPVLGDHGRLYVPNEVVDAYKVCYALLFVMHI
jgi:pyridoxine kinase